ncbi:MAG: aspartate aminotransferase family protein [Candidatus Methanomethyliaceae archaeon]|nr:aspartate aminotransferase family protein [Candidatus Methanomethyliaceae archaeon]MDW7971062.1 aspartate aminotransferase family protein [Nitrososphaerota archaeon]
MSIAKFEDIFLANTFWKRPITLVRGFGAKVWDSEGKEYIDCGCGYGVALLGHCHPKIVDAIKKQCEKLITCHGSFYNDMREECLARLYKIKPKGTERVFLSNSGAEAIEAAIKLVRKFTGKKKIIAMVNSFHGKTIGALSLTWNPKYREPFLPLLEGIKFASYGNIEKLKSLIDEEVGAIFIEPIQGEGGVNIPPPEYLKEVRELCDNKGILFVLDEVQSGFGRTGKIWAHEHFGVKADILCAGKALGGGLPIGATFAHADIMDSLKRGEHSNTFGGNPLVCASCAAAIDVLLEDGLIENAKIMGDFLMNEISKIESKIIREIRGMGLMIGIEMRFEVKDIILEMLKRGVIVLEAGRNVVRLLPPLVIKRDEAEKVISAFEEVVRIQEKNLLG